MKSIKILAASISISLLLVLLSGCYKEQHFDFPGPFPDSAVNVVDSLPFPFDENRQAGVWLMKDGVPDYGKVLFKGFTDYRAMNDTVSWVKESTGMRLIPHRNYYPLSDADHLGGNPNSYQFNYAMSKYFVPVGNGKSFYMYAKVTIGTFSGTAAGLLLGRSWETGGDFLFGFEGSSAVAPTFFVDLYGKLGATVNPDLGWPTTSEVIVPGMPAEMEVVIHDNTFYIKINGRLCFLFKMSRENLYYFTPMIRPWRNFLTVHDFYVESSDMYTVDYVMHEYEKDYARIQSPALAKADNGDLLLFAEGRTNPANAFERVAQNTMPVGNTDIIVKRSSDGGQTWSNDISVIAGDGSNETFAFPQIISTSNGKIILHYSKLTTTMAANGTFTYPAQQTLYQVVSTDNGHTWSQPENIAESLSDVAKGYLKSSPGHGIELQSAAYKGRLVAPLIYGGTSIRVGLSDNNGVTWRKSAAIGGTNIISGSVVELPDTRLMLVLSHSNTSPQSKLVAYSSDGGETWTTPVPMSSLGVATSTYGHMYSGIMLKDNQDKLYLINPVGRKKDAQVYNGPNFGTTPTIFESNNNGVSFVQGSALFTRVAYSGYASPSGNMDAVFTNDGKMIVVYEGGVESSQEGIVVYHK